MDDDDRRAEILRGIEAVEGKFRVERERHAGVTATLRAELHALVQEGDKAGVSLSSMAKAMNISRGRLKRMIEQLQLKALMR